MNHGESKTLSWNAFLTQKCQCPSKRSYIYSESFRKTKDLPLFSVRDSCCFYVPEAIPIIHNILQQRWADDSCTIPLLRVPPTVLRCRCVVCSRCRTQLPHLKNFQTPIQIWEANKRRQTTSLQKSGLFPSTNKNTIQNVTYTLKQKIVLAWTQKTSL